MTEKEHYKAAAKAIKDADALIFSSGAGMGVDSGLPDFRGDEGFWNAYPPIAKLGHSFIDMANPRWFQTNPKLAWAFYGHRFNLYRETKPHKGFSQQLQMDNDKPYGYFVFTSNVDGQYQKAGFSNESIAEVHGSIHHFQCANRCSRDIWKAPDEDVAIDEERFEALEPLPACPNCGGLARPNILMFGDWGWISKRTGEQEERMEAFFDQFDSGHKFAIIETGAGRGVPTVRRFSERVSRMLKAPLIRINPREPGLASSYESSMAFTTGAAETIDNIYREYQKLL